MGVTKDTVVVERGAVAWPKPTTDLFFDCQQRLGAGVEDGYVVGDAPWDLMVAQRDGRLSLGLLGGDYARTSWSGPVPCRVFSDAVDLHNYLDELPGGCREKVTPR